jgi:hypothetical protein
MSAAVMETSPAADANPVAASNGLRIATLLCGGTASFSLNLLGELFWAELLLPVLALVFLLSGLPPGLFRNRVFRFLVFSIVAMFVGYLVSDLAARTPSEMSLRGWARVAALGTSVASLCVICHRDRYCLWWFCLGTGVGGVIAGLLAGMPLAQWKLGYGEHVAYLAVASAALLPMWISSIVILAVGGFSIVVDYRSLGALLMLVGVAVLICGRKIDVRAIRRRLLLGLIAAVAVASVVAAVVNFSQQEHDTRRSVSNIGRFAALRIGAIAIVDSPLIGYGSWGQGTQKYADMYHAASTDELVLAGVSEYVTRRGSSFSAHSQLIQGWMEGGILAAVFFVGYIILLIKAAYRCILLRPLDFMTPLLLYAVGINLWASIMSPFLGTQRITIAVACAAIFVVLKESGMAAAAPARAEGNRAAGFAPWRPPNLMS